MLTVRDVVRVGIVVAAVSVVAGCNAKGGREDYSQSADSGAVAPAMRLDTSMTRHLPDSTAGGAQRTGRPGVAGDTLGTRGQPAGVPTRPADTTRRRP